MVRLTDLRYGPGYFQEPGTVISTTPEEERELVAKGRAVQLETASRPIPETANHKTRPQRGKR